MIRIFPKSRACDDRYQQGYLLMEAIFNDLVFNGNLGGLVPPGTEEVLILTDSTDTVRESAMEIWKDEPETYKYQPDDLIRFELLPDRY